jgi:predicted aldo/keto reductase-like oxidoreductase
MEQRILGKTGFPVSIITFGGIVVDGMEEKEASVIVSEAIRQGVNYFDVAPAYGNAQYVLGSALKPYRSKVYLACKTQKRTAKEARMELEESLRALKTDYLDNYQMHALDDPDEIEQVFAPSGAMETFIRAKEQGYLRNIGFTCHHDSSAVRLIAKGDFDTMLFPVNFAYREQKNGSVSAVKAANEKNMGVIAMKALARRQWLDGEERTYPKCWYCPIYDDDGLARLALNYTLSQDVDTAVPPGDQRMFRLALSIISRQGGNAVNLTLQELESLRREALQTKEVLF